MNNYIILLIIIGILSLLHFIIYSIVKKDRTFDFHKFLITFLSYTTMIVAFRGIGSLTGYYTISEEESNLIIFLGSIAVIWTIIKSLIEEFKKPK